MITFAITNSDSSLYMFYPHNGMKLARYNGSSPKVPFSSLDLSSRYFNLSRALSREHANESCLLF